MSCNKPNCCRKRRAVELELQMKATAEVKQSVEEDLQETDGSISELLESREGEEQEEEDEDTDTGTVS